MVWRPWPHGWTAKLVGPGIWIERVDVHQPGPASFAVQPCCHGRQAIGLGHLATAQAKLA